MDGADERIEAFWRDARARARLDTLPGYFGPGALSLVTPPAWAFGDDPVTADLLAQAVLDGTKTATASAAADYAAEGEPLPEVGTMAIVVDGAGAPRALVVTTRVETVAFDEVDAEHARLEGEGDLSLEHWRAEHRRFFTEVDPHGRGFADDMPVVCERFKVLHPA